MRRLLVLSDLHLEFHADTGREFVKHLPQVECDAVCLCGDIASGRGLALALRFFCERFERVLFTTGNHEFYGSNLYSVRHVLHETIAKHSNLTWLEREVFTFPSGQRVLGTSLWYPPTVYARRYENDWSDFGHIEGLKKWVYDEAQRSNLWLRENLREGDVVMSHFLPSYRSVHLKYAQEISNCYFVHDVEALIEERRPAAWLHGHTHESMDYTLGSTRVVCNPYGYKTLNPSRLNPLFDPTKVLDI